MKLAFHARYSLNHSGDSAWLGLGVGLGLGLGAGLGAGGGGGSRGRERVQLEGSTPPRRGAGAGGHLVRGAV